MENGDSDHSLPSTDSATGSLLMKFWEKESQGSSTVGLHNLVEDKDVAAKAVTLVVNSSRKGVVSLCADVASILRIKKKLEQTIELQHKELLNLRRAGHVSGSGSSRTSRSTSPTPPSFHSYDSAPITHRRSSTQKTSRQSSSRSSPCSTAPTSPSPTRSSSSNSHLERVVNQSTTSGESRDSGTHHHHRHHHHHHSSAEALPNQYLVKAEVHSGPPSDSGIQDDQVSETCPEAPRAAVETSCKEVQCSSLWDENQALEKKFREVCSDKEALETDLQRARQEVDDLRKQLTAREAEASKICGLRIENETSSTWSDTSKPDSEGQWQSAVSLPALQRKERPYRRRHSSPARSLVPGSRPSTTTATQQPRPPSEPRTQSPPHPPAPQLLAGCLCSPCQRLQQEGGRQASLSQGHTVTRGLNHRFTLHLDDQVTTKGDRTGYVRYIGHIDKPNAAHVVYAGLELEKPVGRHDGLLYGKRYFWCHHNHGLFVPLQDIVGAVKKSAKRPKTVDRSHRQGSSSGPDLRHQQGSYPMDIVPSKSGHQTASGKRLLSADSTSLKQNRNLPTPSIT